MTGVPVSPGELVDTNYLNEVVRAHWRKTTSKQVVNTVAETDLLNGEITIGAGAMSINRMLRLTAFGDMINNTGGTVATPRFKLKLGATTIVDTNTVAAVWNTSASRWSWRIIAEIQNLGAANSQWSNLLINAVFGGVTGGANSFTTGEGAINIPVANTLGFYLAEGGNSSAVDTTAAQALALTVTLPSASASEDVTLKGATVELI